MENIQKRFDEVASQVNKICALDLENNEDTVMTNMVSSGIGASAMESIKKLSGALNTTETNDFTVKQQKEGFFGATYNAQEFNFLNRDIEAILESGYNAKVIDQHLAVGRMLGGNPIPVDKAETLTNLTDKMGMKNEKMTYSDFDAKYNTIISFIELADEGNVRLATSNKLYLYNIVINLINEVETNNVNVNEIDIRANKDMLKKVTNPNLSKFINGIGDADIKGLSYAVNSKKSVLNEARKRLESQIFHKVEEDFDMKKCHRNFAKGVQDIQKEMGIVQAM